MKNEKDFERELERLQTSVETLPSDIKEEYHKLIQTSLDNF